MAHQRDPLRIAAEAGNVVVRPADRVGSVLYEGGKAYVRHLAVIGHDHEEALPGEGPPGEGIGLAVPLHPAATVEEHHDRARSLAPLFGCPYVQRLAVFAKRDGGTRLLGACAAACCGIEQREKPGRRGDGDRDAKRHDRDQRDNRHGPLHQFASSATS